MEIEKLKADLENKKLFWTYKYPKGYKIYNDFIDFYVEFHNNITTNIQSFAGNLPQDEIVKIQDIIQKLIDFLIRIIKSKVLISINLETENKIKEVIGKLKNYLSNDKWLKDPSFRSSMGPEEFVKIREDWKVMVNRVEEIKNEITDSISNEIRTK
jgi:hypothetical protein